MGRRLCRWPSASHQLLDHMQVQLAILQLSVPATRPEFSDGCCSPLLLPAAGKKCWGRNTSWRNAPGSSLNQGMKGICGCPAILLSGRKTLRHSLHWPRWAPQWDEALLAHGGGLLDNGPFLVSLPVLSHFPKAP